MNQVHAESPLFIRIYSSIQTCHSFTMPSLWHPLTLNILSITTTASTCLSTLHSHSVFSSSVHSTKYFQVLKKTVKVRPQRLYRSHFRSLHYSTLTLHQLIINWSTTIVRLFIVEVFSLIFSAFSYDSYSFRHLNLHFVTDSA